MQESHVNLPTHCDFSSGWINECPKTFAYSLQRWRDERLCKQPLNCLAKPFVENKLRGGKNV